MDFQTTFINRLQIEKGYRLVADADEQASALPDEDQWYEALDDALEDEDRFFDLLVRFDEAIDHHHATLDPIGGDFDRPLLRSAEGGLFKADLIPAPPLLALKPYAQRILIKQTPFACRALLIVDGGTLNRGLDQNLLIEAAQNLRERDAPEPEDTNGKKPSRAEKKQQQIPIVFEVVLLGPGTLNDSNTAFLKSLRKRTGFSNRVFVSGYILDSSENRVWASSPITAWSRKRYFQYALAAPNQDPEQIHEHLESQGVKPGLVALGVATAMVCFFGGHELISMMGLSNQGHAMLLIDSLSPIIGTGVGLAFNRLQRQTEKQARYTVICWLVLYCGFILYTVWPPGFGAILYLALVAVLVWTVTQLLGVVADMD